MTECGLTSLVPEDDNSPQDTYSVSITECDCPVCLSSIRRKIDAKLLAMQPVVRANTKEAEYQIISEAVEAARTVENLLWGEINPKWGLEEWRRMFRKRNQKIEDINPENPHWKVELKKRLLQNAALSVALIRLVDADLVKSDGVSTESIPSNLPEYAQKPEIKLYVYRPNLRERSCVYMKLRCNILEDFLKRLGVTFSVVDLQSSIDAHNELYDKYGFRLWDVPVLRVDDKLYSSRKVFVSTKLDEKRVAEWVVDKT